MKQKIMISAIWLMPLTISWKIL